MDEGTIVKPEGDLNLKCWVDADFAGLHRRENNANPTSARSRTGYIIALSGVPLHWKAVLQQQVCTSSCESECLALGEALKALLPLIELVRECCTEVGLPADATAAIHADVFEDNNACLDPSHQASVDLEDSLVPSEVALVLAHRPDQPQHQAPQS